MSSPYKVLLVDDEANILRACKRQLRRDGYEVFLAQGAQEALELLGEHRFAVVVSDQRMPEMSGTQLLAKVAADHSETVRIILTGHAEMQDAIEAINRGHVWRFLAKPWDDHEYRLTVRQAVEQYHLVQRNKYLQSQIARQNLELKELNQTLEDRVRQRMREVERLNEDLHASFWGSIKALSHVSEMHSQLIGHHSQRVAVLARALAQHMSMTVEEVREIEIAGLLHDIGKISVPRSILKKPEHARRPPERLIVQRHAVVGEQIVSMIPNLGAVPGLIRAHHEYVDGSGYPDRLTGEAIPLGAKLLAVADHYDKLMNAAERFRSATPARAIRGLRNMGNRFDPGLLDVLERVLQNNRQFANDKEAEILPDQIEVGMVLSRELRTLRGLMLLPKGTRVGLAHLQRLRQYADSDPIAGGVYVFRNPAVMAG